MGYRRDLFLKDVWSRMSFLPDTFSKTFAHQEQGILILDRARVSVYGVYLRVDSPPSVTNRSCIRGKLVVWTGKADDVSAD